MQEKLQKLLARSGYGSRRKIEKMISEGRIIINDKIAKIGHRLELNSLLKVCIDGCVVPVSLSINDKTSQVLAYYKAAGEHCTRNNIQVCPTVFDRLPKLNSGRWISVGRLDVNTSGLLLFTTDGELANRLMHPTYKIEREYAVRVFGNIDEKKIQKLTIGVKLEGEICKFKTMKFIGGKGINRWYKVVLTEGKNREVRRLWGAINIQVSRLIRVRYGNITLAKDLHRSSSIQLNIKDTNDLRKLVNLNTEKLFK